MKKSTHRGHIYCPENVKFIARGGGEPLWKMAAFAFHFIGKICKKCKKPIADHIIVIEEVKP